MKIDEEYNIYCDNCQNYQPIIARWDKNWTDLCCGKCSQVITTITKKVIDNKINPADECEHGISKANEYGCFACKNLKTHEELKTYQLENYYIAITSDGNYVRCIDNKVPSDWVFIGHDHPNRHIYYTYDNKLRPEYRGYPRLKGASE